MEKECIKSEDAKEIAALLIDELLEVVCKNIQEESEVNKKQVDFSEEVANFILSIALNRTIDKAKELDTSDISCALLEEVYKLNFLHFELDDT